VAAGSLKRGEAQPLDQIRSTIHDLIPPNLAVSKQRWSELQTSSEHGAESSNGKQTGFEALFISLLPLDGEFDGPKGETIAKDRSKNSGKRNTALPQGPVTTTERGF